MRWTVPLPGDRRTRRKFFWWPEQKGRTVYWLEYVEVLETYTAWERWWVTEIEPAAQSSADYQPEKKS